MQRVPTTVVAVIGTAAGERARAVGEATNVLAVVPEEGPALERAGQAWREAMRTSRTYLVHDADPLAAVAAAWVAQWDGGGQRGALEVAVAEVTARWRSRVVELPDYYLVLDPEQLSPTARHWYLGVLRGVAPSRVVPLPDTATALERALTRLPSGRWWPDLPDLLDGVDRVVPDHAVGHARAAADATEAASAAAGDALIR